MTSKEFKLYGYLLAQFTVLFGLVVATMAKVGGSNLSATKQILFQIVTL